MDNIGLSALAGLGFALLAHAAFWALSGLAGPQRSLAYPAVVSLMAAVLAWQGIVKATWLPGASGLALVIAAGLLALRRRPRLGALSRVEWLALSLLGLAAAYSAFPDYRPDQWNNDLVLAKAVAAGPLRAPIFEEHVYYGGNYQYLFTLPRWLSADDVFNHGAADAFSWLLLAFGLKGLFARMREEAFAALPSSILLVAWAMFSIPDPVALANAKADPLILLCALAVLELSAGPRRTDSRTLHGLLLGFLLLAPLALKLTWAPFLLALGLAWLVLLAIRRPPPRPEPRSFAAGLLLGLLAGAPYFLNNWRFFGNPLHPAQAGPFRSSYWSESFGHYYDDVAGRATSVAEYFASLTNMVPLLSFHLYAMFVPVLLILAGALLRGRRPAAPGARAATLLRHALSALALFVLTWPLFFRFNIFPRYVYAGVALVLAVLLGVIDRSLAPSPAAPAPARPSGWLAGLALAALLLPAALSELPRQVAFMARFAPAGRERLFVDGPPEWRLARDLNVINQHRRRAAAGSGFYEQTALVDTEGTYHLDSAGFRLWSREYVLLDSALGRQGQCPWLTLSRLDVAYLRTRSSFEQWPEPYRDVIGRLPALDDTGRTLYLAPGVLEALIADEPACRERAPGEPGREAAGG